MLLGDVTVKDSSLTIWFSEHELDEAPWYLWLAHRIIRDPTPGWKEVKHFFGEFGAVTPWSYSFGELRLWVWHSFFFEAKSSTDSAASCMKVMEYGCENLAFPNAHWPSKDLFLSFGGPLCVGCLASVIPCTFSYLTPGSVPDSHLTRCDFVWARPLKPSCNFRFDQIHVICSHI